MKINPFHNNDTQQAWGWPLGRPGGALHRLVGGKFYHNSHSRLSLICVHYHIRYKYTYIRIHWIIIQSYIIMYWIRFQKVLLVSTCIVLSCLKRETKKFEKRLSRLGNYPPHLNIPPHPHHQHPSYHHQNHPFHSHQPQFPGKERENQVGDLDRLDSLTARYVQLTLTQVWVCLKYWFVFVLIVF